MFVGTKSLQKAICPIGFNDTSHTYSGRNQTLKCHRKSCSQNKYMLAESHTATIEKVSFTTWWLLQVTFLVQSREAFFCFATRQFEVCSPEAFHWMLGHLVTRPYEDFSPRKEPWQGVFPLLRLLLHIPTPFWLLALPSGTEVVTLDHAITSKTQKVARYFVRKGQSKCTKGFVLRDLLSICCTLSPCRCSQSASVQMGNQLKWRGSST